MSKIKIYDEFFDSLKENPVTITTRKTAKDRIETTILKQAIQQIIDCDRMSSDEYEKIYGEDSDRDPYVIAEKVMEAIKVIEELQDD